MTFGANRRLGRSPVEEDGSLGGYLRGNLTPPDTLPPYGLSRACQDPSGNTSIPRARSLKPTRMVIVLLNGIGEQIKN